MDFVWFWQFWNLFKRDISIIVHKDLIRNIPKHFLQKLQEIDFFDFSKTAYVNHWNFWNVIFWQKFLWEGRHDRREVIEKMKFFWEWAPGNLEEVLCWGFDQERGLELDIVFVVKFPWFFHFLCKSPTNQFFESWWGDVVYIGVGSVKLIFFPLEKLFQEVNEPPC